METHFNLLTIKGHTDNLEVMQLPGRIWRQGNLMRKNPSHMSWRPGEYQDLYFHC